MAGQHLPSSLATEGRMMLQAMLDDLQDLAELEIILPLDSRCQNFSLPANARIIEVDEQHDVDRLLPEWIAVVDYVWPVAPESAGLLTGIARLVESVGKVLWLSEPETVALCGDKLASYRCLLTHSLPVVETLPLAAVEAWPYEVGVIKPIDGVGCEGSRIVNDASDFLAIRAELDNEAYILQPLINGQAISLSGLFRQGRAWLICLNHQQVAIEKGVFRLLGCVVNQSRSQLTYYQNLVERVALAMPGLWGYVGIDLIETADSGAFILEINPRLTTSYAGIRQATGINVAKQYLTLLTADPVLEYIDSQSVKVVID